jgi:SRSO17 transposase
VEVAVMEAPASEVQERLAGFVAEMVLRLPHVRQRENALVYVRGLLEQGARKSLQPTLFRLGEDAARYESMQQFLADSPWDWRLLQRACAERVAPELGVLAWVIDDTGIPKDGKHSPGVKRQYSGSLDGVGNCQVVVSLHAAGVRGTVPMGWQLYLPQEWCEDADRRARAKVPARVEFATKPRLARALIEQAAGWDLPRAPILGDCAYGDDSTLRHALHEQGLDYLLAIQGDTRLYGPETRFVVPARWDKAGRRATAERPSRRAERASELAARLPAAAWQQLPYRDQEGETVKTSRFAAVRVLAAHPLDRDERRHWEWLIIEWPEGDEKPTGFALSNLPESESAERLARLMRLRWTIELDYRQLKGELGLAHYEGRSYLGFHHHCALVTTAHAFLTLERLDPKAPQPA